MKTISSIKSGNRNSGHYNAWNSMKRSLSLFSGFNALHFALIICMAIAFASCSNDDTDSVLYENPGNTDSDRAAELESVKYAVKSFEDINNAVAAGFSMESSDYLGKGIYYYTNKDRLDHTFEMDKPEGLLYRKMSDGSLSLVAVAYRVRYSISNYDSSKLPRPPYGFSGTDDFWSNHTATQIWALNVWINASNPEGVFATDNTSISNTVATRLNQPMM
ncbi:hypothetical protein [Robertkochia solimangrovi]|uniref:hypothetical protein n=1 Tax=Robertkochia solimangrovi TaxID=2213046 RepID=UPI00117CBB4D|nr:hypothetical protein [Robertkochia solimangrovi]TRZ45790.1 hypothetical protein DMZ48_00485 [Robertkochia solimangrovi]